MSLFSRVMDVGRSLVRNPAVAAIALPGAGAVIALSRSSHTAGVAIGSFTTGVAGGVAGIFGETAEKWAERHTRRAMSAVTGVDLDRLNASDRETAEFSTSAGRLTGAVGLAVLAPESLALRAAGLGLRGAAVAVRAARVAESTGVAASLSRIGHTVSEFGPRVTNALNTKLAGMFGGASLFSGKELLSTVSRLDLRGSLGIIGRGLTRGSIRQGLELTAWDIVDQMTLRASGNMLSGKGFVASLKDAWNNTNFGMFSPIGTANAAEIPPPATNRAASNPQATTPQASPQATPLANPQGTAAATPNGLSPIFAETTDLAGIQKTLGLSNQDGVLGKETAAAIHRDVSSRDYSNLNQHQKDSLRTAATEILRDLERNPPNPYAYDERVIRFQSYGFALGIYKGEVDGLSGPLTADMTNSLLSPTGNANPLRPTVAMAPAPTPTGA